MDERRFILSLRFTKGLGFKTYSQLLIECGNIQNLFESKGKDLKPKFKNLIQESIKLYNSPDLENLIDINKVSYVVLTESEYPSLLKQIADPPLVLFYKGNLNSESLEKSISVVGTRKPSTYGKKITRDIVTHFSQSGYTIVSGLAFGVDALSHITALQNDVYTVAVLASSPDQCSPRTNQNIYNAILDKGGCIVSENAPGEEINPGMFASRNRIIAGLSRYTIVTEAGIKSGALITADCAFDYNREVFAVPGNIYSENSQGCHNLIHSQKASLYFGHHSIADNRVLNQKVVTNQFIGNSKLHTDIFNVIQSMPVTIEDIVLQVQDDYEMIIRACSELELDGIIEKLHDSRYSVR